jgi:hypothetical protein
LRLTRLSNTALAILTSGARARTRSVALPPSSLRAPSRGFQDYACMHAPPRPARGARHHDTDGRGCIIRPQPHSSVAFAAAARVYAPAEPATRTHLRRHLAEISPYHAVCLTANVSRATTQQQHLLLLLLLSSPPPAPHPWPAADGVVCRHCDVWMRPPTDNGMLLLLAPGYHARLRPVYGSQSTSRYDSPPLVLPPDTRQGKKKKNLHPCRASAPPRTHSVVAVVAVILVPRWQCPTSATAAP